MGGRGKEGEPIEWTGSACRLKCVIEANPDHISVTTGPRVRKHSEVIVPQAAQKSLYRELPPPVPHTDTGRQRAISSGERATLC